MLVLVKSFACIMPVERAQAAYFAVVASKGILTLYCDNILEYFSSGKVSANSCTVS